MPLNLCCDPEIVGRDEQEGGAMFVRLWSPTDLDNATNAIRLDLKQHLGYYDGFKYLGMFGGPVEDFLKDYIDTSYAAKKAYSPLNKGAIYNYMTTHYDYDTEDLDVYFGSMVRLKSQGKIAKTIYEPYTYIVDDSTIPEKATKYLVKSLLIAGVGYLVIRTVIFSGPQLIGKYSDPNSYKRKKRRRK